MEARMPEPQTSRSRSESRREPGAQKKFYVRFTREQRYMHAVLFTTFPGTGGHRPADALQRELLGAQICHRRGRIRRHSLFA